MQIGFKTVQRHNTSYINTQ